jgi:hypothetical protein
MDNVHYAKDGYEQLATVVPETVITKIRLAAAKFVAGMGTSKRRTTYF